MQSVIAAESRGVSVCIDFGVGILGSFPLGFALFDWTEYLRKNDTRTVKKTLTIPAWLNALAEEQHINFSSVLKSALIEKLHA